MKRRMKKAISALALSTAAILMFSGCGSQTSAATGTSGSTQSEDGKITISFWHSMSGDTQTALEKVVDGFNESQDTYQVVAENQGTYDESTGKFFNMANGSGSAQIIQIGEQNLQSMIDSGMVASISELIDTYNFDDSDLLEQVVNFYTVDGQMYAMPFNCSSPVVYYNKEVFDAAGVTEFPTTFEGIMDAAQAIAESDDSITPVGMYAYGYALDQMVTNMGGFTVNNDNGRSDRATEVAYQDQMTEIFNWIKDLQDAGYLLNYGTDGTNTISGFTQRQVAMFISTSASCRNVIDSSDFEVGVSALPVPEGVEAQGVYAGGGALCAAAGMDEETAQGVMDFFTYATSPEVQAQWAADTGYFPICNAAYETDSMISTYEEYPQLRVAADQLLNSQVNEVTAGPLLSQLPQLRTDIQTALEAVFNGEEVEASLQQAVDSTNSAIANANAGVE
ncbi:MAG TPA: extracellular solute-binding protein [Candidatus Pullilachnospira stercoravium]|uniref:Extracellular solute-binding protein n=1 Tax=Candidatus Pullilachnospira stercoravium TaxID=2840913 RepID=A0A9D1NW78_9FIRM|nr:extracellular solute-binding protein [Candidatus Pullilachnospira stercoravium]